MSGYRILWVDNRETKELEKAVKRVGNVAPKVIRIASSKGTTIVRRMIRSRIPIGETGELRKGIIRKAERSKHKGKKIYDLMFDPKKNDIFQKPVKHPGEAGSKNTKNGHAYYPKSVDAGFITRDKGWTPGYHFMAEGAEEGFLEAKKKMIDTAIDEINKEWKK